MTSQALPTFSTAAIAAAMAMAMSIPGLAFAGDRAWRETQPQPVSNTLKWLPAGEARPFFSDLPTDLWDRPFVVTLTSARTIVFYSMGPNGLDDDGRGDDITPEALDDYYRLRKVRHFF
ncbi:MAG: hypothetical protein M3O62_18950 [Pseudomonadota bacterium]|nr:hypothetical protein [Pseudomonadota bacterium]